MLNKIQGKLEAAISKAVSGNVDMRSLLIVLQTIGVVLAMILGALAILIIIFLSGSFGQ